MGLIGIDVAVNPRETTVSMVLRHVRRGRLDSVHTLHDGVAEVYEAQALETSALVGKPLRELHLGGSVIVGAVVRDGQVMSPRGGTEIRAGDRIVVLARTDMVKRVEKLFAVRPDFF